VIPDRNRSQSSFEMTAFPPISPDTAPIRTGLDGFLHDDCGAVTVDWVVLTASIVGLALATLIGVHQATVTIGPKINDSLHTAQVPTFAEMQ